MSWSLIISLIIAFLPYILPWLEKLFDRAGAKMGVVPEEPRTFRYELEELFNQAESEMSWWDFFTGKRAKLRLVRRLILRRSDEFLVAAKTGAGASVITPLTTTEYAEVRDAFQSYKLKG